MERTLPASTNKKVLVRRFDREPVAGYVNPQTWLQATGIEVLTQSGAMLAIPYDQIKAAVFVREFEEPTPESHIFHTRPRMHGLWVRLRFRDGDLMDGLMPNNLLQMEPYGLTVSPPNPGSPSQRVFVPRTALAEVSVLGVVGSVLKTPKPKPKEQIELFDR